MPFTGEGAARPVQHTVRLLPRRGQALPRGARCRLQGKGLPGPSSMLSGCSPGAAQPEPGATPGRPHSAHHKALLSPAALCPAYCRGQGGRRGRSEGTGPSSPPTVAMETPGGGRALLVPQAGGGVLCPDPQAGHHARPMRTLGRGRSRGAAGHTGDPGAPAPAPPGSARPQAEGSKAGCPGTQGWGLTKEWVTCAWPRRPGPGWPSAW